MKFNPRPALKKLWAALDTPAPAQAQQVYRIEFMERNIVLLAKAVYIWLLFQSFFFSKWMNMVSDDLGVAYDFTQYFFWAYIAMNALFAVLVLRMHHVPIAVVQWGVFAISLVDGLFVAVMMQWTGGYDSILFWIFLALIIRNAVSIPPGISQIILNLGVVGCYILSCVGSFTLANSLSSLASNLSDKGEKNEDTLRIMGLTTDEGTVGAIFVRVVLLTLFAICCYGLQVLLERQRRELEEASEFTAREVQLRSAGRLAAEFAHQIKNPLAIMNTALFSLQRALNEKRPDTHAQIEIIREEITRSDRIITQVMDYAQLTEGRLERLDLIEELNRSIEQVFPAAASRNIRVERDYGRNLPPLVMQRPHLSEILVNVLQNAREAVKENGTVIVQAVGRPDRAVEIIISDTGAGIPPDKIERVFEAYYTTKERGSGLGLSIVKHNAELYGGTVHVESRAGKGARFIIEFPEKTLVKLGRPKN